MQVQRDLYYAIDEVDNILIDEARTPLIVSVRRNSQPTVTTSSRSSSSNFVRIGALHCRYQTQIGVTHQWGVDKVEELAGIPASESIYDDRYIDLTHYLEQALKSGDHFPSRQDYIVRDGEVIIVDGSAAHDDRPPLFPRVSIRRLKPKEGVRVRRQNVDDSHDHLSELLSHVREAGQHDGYRKN
ncbi:MAG: hypothetical protein R2839_10790 [Thermomicrobiales bacterium]